jgi:RMKL-like, methyltransferase domain
MVRRILNAMGIQQGDTVLDPMMGSGTTPVETALMGIDSIGLDASPFCVFMAETKGSGLTMSLARAEGAFQNIERVYEYFANKYGAPQVAGGAPSALDRGLARIMEEGEEYVVSGQRFRDKETADTYALLFLAFLDAMGYAQRTARKNLLELFRGILERYLHTCKKFQTVRQAHDFNLGKITGRCGDARAMDLPAASIDGILFSPPYSFAIDYVGNDAFHLDALGVDRRELNAMMIGIRGGNRLAEKYACYLEDMRQVLKECYRVLRAGRYCVIVIGTNSNQLSKVLKTSREGLTGLHEIVRGEAQAIGFSFITQIERLINGISNTMRDEFIVFLRKP